MRIFLYFLLLVFLFGLSKTNVSAQYLNSDSAFLSGAANTGRLYTNIFLDYYYKTHIDSLIRGTGVNQYSGVTKDKNAFAFRRIYLGYDYNISIKFSTELLLAAEDQLYITTLSGANTYSGDLLPNNKYSFYIKLANLRWKNIWKRTDLVVGQSNTPAFPFLTQKIWGYRNLEKTIADIRKIPSIDLGVSLQGKFDRDDKYGYSVMIGNGTGARVENDRFKRLYGEIYGKFFNKKIIVDLYADYERQDWTTNFHHSKNMIKGMIAYSTPSLTIGLEAFSYHLNKDVVGINNIRTDTLNATATAVSAYLHTDLIKNKLRFIIRYDWYNPDTKYNHTIYKYYKSFSPTFEPNNNEIFFTTGLDYTLSKTVHILPNIWYNKFITKQAIAPNTDYDLVYRLTVNYFFGK